MDLLFVLLSGGAAGAVVVWLLRNWISERLRQSIAYEYSQKLETYKSELNAKLATLAHEFELNQLRTSLFFEHQRIAYAEILSEIASVQSEWFGAAYERDAGFTDSVPETSYKRFLEVYYRHQLFLDSACTASIELVVNLYRGSSQDLGVSYERIEYLQPRIGDLFRQRIGVEPENAAAHEIALPGAMRLINHYHFGSIGLPPSGHLRVERGDDAADVVIQGEEHLPELVAKLREFHVFLHDKQHGVFHEAATSIYRYLVMLGARAEND